MKPRKKWGTALVVLVATVGTSHLMQTFGSASAVEPATAPAVSEPDKAPATDADSELSSLAPDLATTIEPTAAILTPAAMFTALTRKLPDYIPARFDARENPPRPPAPITPVPEMPHDAATPAPLPTPGPSPLDRLARADGDSTTGTITDTPSVNEYGMSCDVILSAAERPSAMVNLSVAAPCHSGSRLTVRHDDLIFSAQLDALGLYNVMVPALSETAVFTVTFADGEVAHTDLTVHDAARTERVALQYNGRTGLQIHALEFGADYGDAGHVWAGNPRDAETAVKMGGGYLTALGDPTLDQPFLAEVYTLPGDVVARDGVVRLNVEAEVSSGNCAKTIAGQTLQRQPDGAMTPVALTLSMPDCDAIGEFLVLKNLLRDLKIASN